MMDQKPSAPAESNPPSDSHAQPNRTGLRWQVKWLTVMAAISGILALQACQMLPGSARGESHLDKSRFVAIDETRCSISTPNPVLRETDDGIRLKSAAMSPDGCNALAVGSDGVILRSEDAGRNWHKVDSGSEERLWSVTLGSNNRSALAVGDSGTILYSEDAGLSWREVDSGSEEYLWSVTLGSDNRSALAVGDRGTILRSEDAGKSWYRADNSNVENLKSVTLMPDNRGALAVGYYGTILRSEDAGKSWYWVNSRSREHLRSVAVGPNNRTTLAVGDRGIILRSEDLGQTWHAAGQAWRKKELTIDSGVTLRSVAIGPGGDNALAVGDYGIILISEDAGQTWHEVYNKVYNSNLNDLMSVILNPDGYSALAVGERGATLYSRHAGKLWVPARQYKRHDYPTPIQTQ